MARPPRFVVVLLLAGLASHACSDNGKRATASESGSTATTAASASPTTTATGATSTSASAADANAPDTGAPGDIPDNQVFVPYTFAPGSYTVKVPEGWPRTDASDGTVKFTDNFNSVELGVTSSAVAPSEQSARDTEVPLIQSTTPGFQLENVTTVHRKAGPAILVTYRAASPPSTVTGKSVTLAVERYEFWQAGKEAIVTLSGPVGADNVDPWRTVTDSFAWV
jgi:hypothetical protein